MKKALFSVLVFTLLSVTGCAPMTSSENTSEKMMTQNSDDSQAVITSLESAEVISLKKNFINLGGDFWTVKADGVEVATIRGQAFYLIGDTYSMYSNEGNFVGAEGEELRVVNSSAKIYNARGEENGSIKQSINPILVTLDIKNAEGETIGVMKQNINYTLDSSLKDSSGSDAWKFFKTPFVPGASIKLEKMSESEISVMDAIWVTVITNEISEAKASRRSSNSSK